MSTRPWGLLTPPEQKHRQRGRWESKRHDLDYNGIAEICSGLGSLLSKCNPLQTGLRRLILKSNLLQIVDFLLRIIIYQTVFQKCVKLCVSNLKNEMSRLKLFF